MCSNVKSNCKRPRALPADLPDDRVALVQDELLFLALEEELPAAHVSRELFKMIWALNSRTFEAF